MVAAAAASLIHVSWEGSDDDVGAASGRCQHWLERLVQVILSLFVPLHMVDAVIPPLGVGGGAVGFPAHVQNVVKDVEDYGFVVAILLSFPDMVSQRDDSIRSWLPVSGFDERDPLAAPITGSTTGHVTSPLGMVESLGEFSMSLSLM